MITHLNNLLINKWIIIVSMNSLTYLKMMYMLI